MFATRTDWSLRPNLLSQVLGERRRLGLEVFDLTESNPTHCGFALDSQAILGALADPRSLTYQPDPRGLLAARQAVAGYYAERGVKLDPEQIFLTTSTSEAYSYVFRLLGNPGDNILTPRPSYPLLDFLARLDDLELLSYPLIYDHGWQMDLDALQRLLSARTRAVLVVHPNNPTGSFVREKELEFLHECARRLPLAVIADEVFADYAFSPIRSLESGTSDSAGAALKRVVTHAANSEALTFTLSGLSKISALPQMKLAWVVINGPAGLLGEALARLEVIADTYLSVSAPLAHALPKLLETRHSLQAQIVERVHSNLRWLDAELLPSSRVGRLEMEGGWYVVLKLPAIRSDEDWAVDLVRRDGVLVHPGHFYDFAVDGHLVVSLLVAPEVFQKGIRRILARVESN